MVFSRPVNYACEVTASDIGLLRGARASGRLTVPAPWQSRLGSVRCRPNHRATDQHGFTRMVLAPAVRPLAALYL